MLRIIVLLCLLVLIAVQAETINYIMALKSPVTEETFKQARADVEASGGIVTYEFRAAFKAILAQLPSQEFAAFNSKPYVDFLEADKSVHIS